MTTTYQPPVWSENSIPAVRSTDTECELMNNIYKEQKTQGIESPEAAEARKEREQMGLKQSTINTMVFAGVSFICSFFTVWMHASWIVDLANFFPLFIAPYSVAVRRKLNRMPSLREVHNRLRLRVNEIMMENNELVRSEGKLENRVQRIQEVENRLQEVAAKSGHNANELLDLVKENGRIIRKMKELQESSVMTECLKAVISSDRSQDSCIDANEMNMLILRLKSIPGLNLSERNLRAAFRVQHSHSIRAIISVTKKILKQDQLQVNRQSENLRQCRELRKSTKLGYTNIV